MNHLIPCTHCNRHVRSHEAQCPFCNEALSSVPEAQSRGAARPRHRSRAAAFAMRAAIVAGAAPAIIACSDNDGHPRDETQRDVVANGGSSAAPDTTQNGGSSAGSNANGGSGSSAGDEPDPNQDAVADAGTEADADYVPVPIYGGVFPDPMTRARV